MSPSSELLEFFRVPTEFQLRFRPLSDEEKNIFSQASMRPSPYSALRSELDAMIESSRGGEFNRGLIERAFQILINIDQRLERIEEDLHQLASGGKSEVQSFQWYRGELGAKGLLLEASELKDFKFADSQELLLDLLLPSLPEHRIVCTAKSYKLSSGHILFFFDSIHEDDLEYLHRYLASREREMLRARASQKKDA